MNNLITNLNILNALVVGVEFEFYAEFSTKETASLLSKLINRKVLVCDTKNEEVEDKTAFLLKPDFSGGKKMMELITPPINWNECKILMIKILKWIDENGWTNEKTAIHVNMSFNEFKIQLNNKLTNLNKLKFILNFDENKVYQNFKNRKNSIYARSINYIYPLNKFVFSTNIKTIDINNYLLPKEKYFGINFGKIDKNYFEVRYLGGKDYQKKVNDIIGVTEYIANHTYTTLQEGFNWNKEEIDKLKTILDNNKKVIQSFSDMENFMMNYPNLTVLVDLKGDIEILKTKWNHIREKLFELITFSKLNKGLINYDSDCGKFQLKDIKLKEGFIIKNMELINCEISGNIENCDLYNCIITKSHITNSKIISGTSVENSKVIETQIHPRNIIKDCYIDSKTLEINGKIEGGIIRSGVIGSLSEISKETELIDVVDPNKKTKKK